MTAGSPRRRRPVGGSDAPPDRAAVPVIAYVLVLAVASVLVAAIVTAGGGFVSDQRETGARSQLNVLGQQVAADVATADRLVRTTDSPAVSLERRLPRQVVRSAYTIRLVSGSPPTLELSTTDPDVTVTIDILVGTPVDDSVASGGTVRVVFNASTSELEVRDG